MMARWSFQVLLGLLCLQAYHAFSPIPEENWDSDWIQYNAFLRDPAYRLPTTTRPNHYTVTLAPILDTIPANVNNVQPFTVDGEVTITIRATQENVNEIVLHCNDLTISELRVYAATAPTVNLASTTTFACEMPWSFLRIPLTTALNTNLQYVIESRFRGNLQTNMRGFYRSWFIDSNGNRRWMATTQFQPGHARQAFPCYDEPEFKSTFDITMIRDSSLSPTISNMPIRDTTTTADGRTSETFYTTPLTSTYLLAFIVSNYQRVASNDDPERPFHIYARDSSGNTGDFSLEIGEKLLLKMEEFTDYHYYTMTANIIMQQAAIPDFSAGAMENWGLLTYREALILYDPENSNHFYRQRIANIIAHEITHMWFGNLVTCAWWDNLWLNEGFARYYTYYLAEWVAPEMAFETRFIVEQVHSALLSDSVDSAHALTNPNVNDPASVSAHFSTITYAKGASILRMTEHMLTPATFQKALQQYLLDNEFDVAEPQDLFTALDRAAAADSAMSRFTSVSVEDYFKTWSEQAGHPLLTVVVDHTTGRMTVTQERWNVQNTGVSTIASLWYVPITWTRAGDVDFIDTRPTQMLSGTSTTIDRGSTGLEWVIFNKQQSGFYRVNYDSVTWSLITRALRDSTSRVQIHEYNRAQIVDDVFILARSGVIPYSRAFNILSFLEFEDQYTPWIAAITGFNFARRRLAHNDENLDHLLSLANQWSSAITRRLGFAEIAGESYMDGLLRMYVNTFLCNIGHEECVAAGITNFANWKNNNQRIPPNMRPWVYCTGLRYGDADDFDFFWNRYLVEDLASEQVVMLTAAGCTRDEPSLQRYLNAITAGDNDYTLREQDYSTALSSAITSNEINNLRAFEWLQSNIQRTTDAFGSIATPLNTIASRLLTTEQITEVNTWIEANRVIIGESAYNSGISGLATARSNIAWYDQRVPEFELYFENGYLEDVIELEDNTTPSTTTEIAPTTDGIITTPQDDSASVAALSFVTLLVTLAINLF